MWEDRGSMDAPRGRGVSWVLGVGCWVLGVGCWAFGIEIGCPLGHRDRNRNRQSSAFPFGIVLVLDRGWTTARDSIPQRNAGSQIGCRNASEGYGRRGK